MSISLPIFITHFGLRSGVKPLALASPFSEKPDVRYVRDFNLGFFYINEYIFFYPLR